MPPWPTPVSGAPPWLAPESDVPWLSLPESAGFSTSPHPATAHAIVNPTAAQSLAIIFSSSPFVCVSKVIMTFIFIFKCIVLGHNMPVDLDDCVQRELSRSLDE